ncbi:MAG: hypothetical protein HC767_12035 [Akkermansiaceae bacterium]|nr:hypothetical protein [Akkermansiaceae bacterium]
MIRIVILLSLFCLSSCVHTAVTALSNPSGVPVVIKVPNADVKRMPRKSQLIAIDESISDSSHNRQALQRYFPGVEPSDVRTQWQIVGFSGVATPKKEAHSFSTYL